MGKHTSPARAKTQSRGETPAPRGRASGGTSGGNSGGSSGGSSGAHERFRCRYFVWILYRRPDNDLFYADGRGNRSAKLPGGKGLQRYSLGTAVREEAIEALHELDTTMAVRSGLAPASVLSDASVPLSIEDGMRLYLEHVGRPRSAGGVKPQTVAAYRRTLERFRDHAATQRVHHWNRVDDALLTRYLSHREALGYKPRTLRSDAVPVKAAVKHLIEAGRLPESARLKTRLRLSRGSPTYCYRVAEVRAMVEWCRRDPSLQWLGDVIEVLAHTGLRIGELAQLRWRHIDVENRWLHVIDESADHVDATAGTSTKTGNSRAVPLDDPALAVLERRLRGAVASRGTEPETSASTKRDADADAYVFFDGRGDPLRVQNMSRELRRHVIDPLAEAWELPESDRGFRRGRVHSLRHYFCSQCAAAGIPMQTTQQWLGHKDSDMTRHYYHLHDEESHRQMARLQQHLAVASSGASENRGSSEQHRC